jgi:Tfp pilus assembly protein PilO
MITRRQRQQYLYGVILGGLALINLLFFLILYRPARNEYFQLRESIETLQAELQVRQQSVARLETVSSQLGLSEQDRRDLLSRHFVTRDEGFAEILPVLDSMTRRTGVRNDRKDYAIDAIPQYGLYSVKIRFEVQGAYPNVVNFIKELESSDTFFITNAIDVRGAADGQQFNTGNVALTLALETFFYE